jgi:hypothetical protein
VEVLTPVVSVIVLLFFEFEMEREEEEVDMMVEEEGPTLDVVGSIPFAVAVSTALVWTLTLNR